MMAVCRADGCGFLLWFVCCSWTALAWCRSEAASSLYGIEGLKVADLSICPTHVAVNTYSTALVIWEKAVVIMAEELASKMLPERECTAAAQGIKQEYISDN